MPNIEILSDGVVINTIIASEEFAEQLYPGQWRLSPNQTPEPTPVPQQHITKLAFLSRFTDEEAISLDLASMGATVEAATLRRYMAKVEAATFIDLSREDTRDGVQTLEALGVLGEGRAVEILDSPVLPHEIPT